MRIVGVGDMIDVLQLDPSVAQAELNRMKRQLPGRKRHWPLAVLDVREPLFLRRGKNDAIFHQAGGWIVIDSVDAEGVHGISPKSKVQCPKSMRLRDREQVCSRLINATRLQRRLRAARA